MWKCHPKLGSCWMREWKKNLANVLHGCRNTSICICMAYASFHFIYDSKACSNVCENSATQQYMRYKWRTFVSGCVSIEIKTISKFVIKYNVASLMVYHQPKILFEHTFCCCCSCITEKDNWKMFICKVDDYAIVLCCYCCCW